MQRLAEEGINRAGPGVDEAGHAAKKHPARHINPEEIERRIDDQLEQARVFSRRDPLLRLEPGIDDLLADLDALRFPLARRLPACAR